MTTMIKEKEEKAPGIQVIASQDRYTADAAAAGRLGDFQTDGEPILCRRFGSGHINDTFLVVDETARSYILQKINKNVFRDPLKVMQNIVSVTSHLAKSAVSHRNVLELIPTIEDGLWTLDEEGDFWRLYSFITDSLCYQRSESEALFRESAVAFGTFQRNLADFPANTLHATIPRFHDTPNRYAQFSDALKEDARGRAGEAAREIEFALRREERGGVLMKRYAEGALPLRVTHNDTKLSNVLFDRRTGKNLCVVDLDTVMPGFSVTDFGDSIRFGATNAAEDEKDLGKVNFSLSLFEAYADGFLSACGENLSPDETDSLCDGALVITLENGVRFLTDYLNGDTYYRISYEGQNLDRCRTQFKLVSDMEARWGEMQAAIRKYRR